MYPLTFNISMKLLRNKNKQKRTAKKNIFQVKRKSPPKPSRPPSTRSPPKRDGNMAHLISNPCYGPLEGVATIGGIIERVRNVNSLQTAANGYIVWFPSYSANSFVADSFSNCLFYQNSVASTQPINNPLSTGCLGSLATSTTGTFIQDPAFPNLTGGTFSRSRTLAACITAHYTGQLSAVQGEIAYISNVRVSDLVGTNLANPVYPSVDTLFAYSRTVHRTSMDPMEIVWRPTDLTSKFRSTNTSALTDPTSFRLDCPTHPDTFWQCGNNVPLTANLTTISATDTAEAVGIVFLWRGFPASNQLTFRLTKVIELELAPSGNAIEQIVVTPAVPVKIDSAVARLDRSSSLWQTPMLNRAVHGVIDALAPPMIAPFAKAVYSGISQLIG